MPMSTTTTSTSPAPAQMGERGESCPPYKAQQYRTFSRMAMLSLIFGLLSFTAFVAPPLAVFSLFGVATGWLALRSIKRFPDELSGRQAALVGCVLCALTFVGSVSRHSYIYATEVPDGYDRISFKVLQPRSAADIPVPKSALDLDGKSVFVSGYIHPDAAGAPVQSFVLVPDMGTCCFGGQPALTDMIEVTLTGRDRVRYSHGSENSPEC